MGHFSAFSKFWIARAIRDAGWTCNHGLDVLMAVSNRESQRALLYLLPFLRDKLSYCRVIHYLGERGRISPLHYFHDILLESEHSQLSKHQLAAFTYLRRYPPESVIPLLVAILRDSKHRWVVHAALFRLSELATDEAVYWLAHVMKEHPQSELRAVAAHDLGWTCHPQALSALLDVIENSAARDNWRYSPMDSIRRLLEDGVIPAQEERLLALLSQQIYRDLRRGVETGAAWKALGHLDTPAAETCRQHWAAIGREWGLPDYVRVFG